MVMKASVEMSRDPLTVEEAVCAALLQDPDIYHQKDVKISTSQQPHCLLHTTYPTS